MKELTDVMIAIIDKFLETIVDDGDNEYYLSKPDLYNIVLDDFKEYLKSIK